MLRSTAFPALYNFAQVPSRAHTCHSLQPARSLHSTSSFVSCRQFRQPLVNLAAEKRQWSGGAELAGADDEEDGFGDEYDDEEQEFDDDEGMLPLEKMNKWFEKKPKGFGEGKVYDTSVEEKLLEEMRQSRIAQAENLKRLKNEELVQIGSRVRLGNLPKKKNIHKDLKSALQGIPGIINITPAVTGNKKTRDPICKGFAFVDFKHEKDAVRFVELYTGQTITFGKIQKQIKYSNEDSNMDGSSPNSWVETSSDDLNYLDYQMDEEEQEDGEDNQESVAALRVDGDDYAEMRIDPEITSLPSDQVDRNPTDEKSFAKVKQENARKKKPTSKERGKKVLGVPGSARRLKIREKAVLNDVFSKYGLKSTLASKDS
ncbi:hypothetical protein Fmac_003366 [Flemingia macrophylla]|uniref:RRM domain-containing protein n=1 Tax=Flemingia macrophylla TaxID=520843 RepID=A0ABD1NN75_9FABA